MGPAVTPAEALRLAILYPYAICNKRGLDKPGGVICRLGSECRSALKRLTSDELAKIRVEWWELEDEGHTRRQRFRDLKLAFDRQLARA